MSAPKYKEHIQSSTHTQGDKLRIEQLLKQIEKLLNTSSAQKKAANIISEYLKK